MKKKIIITGSAVHEVGYHGFLLNRALSEGNDGFSVSNEICPEGTEQVVVLSEGDEESIQEYCRLIPEEFPSHARVSNITDEPYNRRVIKIIDNMQLVQVEPLDKVIPVNL